MVDAAGEAFELDVFSATPGCSRCRRLVCSPTRTTDDLLLCLLETFLFFGGVPEGAATDNMGAPVVLRDGKGPGPGRAWRFVKEAGVDLRPRAPSSPQAKGKDESTNRFANRLRAYDGDFDGLGGLRVDRHAAGRPARQGGGVPEAPGQRGAAALDGRGRERAGRAVDDARAHRREVLAGAQAPRRREGHRRGDARRPGGRQGRRRGRRLDAHGRAGAARACPRHRPCGARVWRRGASRATSARALPAC